MKFTRDQFVWYDVADVRLPAIIVHVPGERHADGWVHPPDAYSIVVLCQPDGGAGRWGTRAHVAQLSAFAPESEAKGGGCGVRHTPESVRAACECAGIRIGDAPVSRDARGDFVRVWHMQSDGGTLITVCEADDGELWYFGARIHPAWPTDPPAAFHGSIPHDTNGDIK